MTRTHILTLGLASILALGVSAVSDDKPKLKSSGAPSDLIGGLYHRGR